MYAILSAGVPIRRPLTSVSHTIARGEPSLNAASITLTTSSAVPSTSRVSSLGESTTPIRRSISVNLVGLAEGDALGIEAPIELPVEAGPLPFFVSHPLVEHDPE